MLIIRAKRDTLGNIGEMVLAGGGKAVVLPQIIQATIAHMRFGIEWDLNIHALASVPIACPVAAPSEEILDSDAHLDTTWWEWPDRDDDNPDWWDSPKTVSPCNLMFNQFCCHSCSNM